MSDYTSAVEVMTEIFSGIDKIFAKDDLWHTPLKDEKKYELRALADLIVELKRAGYRIKYQNSTIKFKQKPGKIRLSDAHFDVYRPYSSNPSYKIFIDISARPLSSIAGETYNTLDYHSFDIAIINISGVHDNSYPDVNNIVLGAECKTAPILEKDTIKELLGVRRQMSYFSQNENTELFSSYENWPSNCSRRSEYRLYCIDPGAWKYKDGLDYFGIKVINLAIDAP